MEHFLVQCEEFRWERQDLLEKIRLMEGTHEWMEEYGRVELEGKMALLLRRSTESLEREGIGWVSALWRKRGCGGRGRRNWLTVEVPMNLDPYNPQTRPPPCNS